MSNIDMIVFLILPLAFGLCLAPWLTMVARGPLAGAVFAVALPLFLWAVGLYLRLPVSLFWLAFFVLGATGAALTWRTFLRLESTGTPTSALDLSIGWRRRERIDRPGRTQNAVWLLVKKELRLQQITFLISGVFAVAWLAVVIARSVMPEAISDTPLYVAAFLHGGLVPLMSGALASAEERQFGAAHWQVLLPFAAWKQWSIKAGVALALAFGLAVILPLLLEMIASEPGFRLPFEPETVLMICVAALYVSSLSTSGIRALLATPPAIAAAMFVAAAGLPLVFEATRPAVRQLAGILQPIVLLDRTDYYWWKHDAARWVLAGFAFLVFFLAFANHRTADRSRGRILRQLVWLCVYGIAAFFTLTLVSEMTAMAIRLR